MNEIPLQEKPYHLGLTKPKEVEIWTDPTKCIWAEWKSPLDIHCVEDAELFCTRPGNEGEWCDGVCGYAQEKHEEKP